MEELFFGVEAKLTDKIDLMNVLARMYLSPSIEPEHVTRLLQMLESGQLSQASFDEKTDAEIAKLRDMKENGEDILPMTRDKWMQWNAFFHETPTDNEFDYIQAWFGLSKEDLLGEDSSDSQVNDFKTARELADYVKQYVKGQDEAIEQLAVPFYQHLDSKRNEYTSLIKSASVVMGPTGIGKSEMLRVFGEACDCPIIRINTADIVPASWRGLHISDVFYEAICDGYSLGELEYAVVVFHEFDKIVHRNQSLLASGAMEMDFDMMRDIMRLFETQHSLHIEPTMSHLGSTSYDLPIDNLLIIFDGAFYGMDKIVKKRLSVDARMGNSSAMKKCVEKINWMSLVANEDLVTWGYSPELVGRIGNVVAMNPLSVDVIYEIITTAENSVVKMHVDYCAQKNVELHFEDEALRYIAEEAFKSELGVRNVKTLMAKGLKNFYYDFPQATSSEKVAMTVTKDYLMRNIKGQSALAMFFQE